MKTIVSFGDSFIFGSELQNNHDGSKAWPGLIATDFNCNYKTFAEVGCGNEAIARQIFTYFSSNSSQDTLAVINWTWCMRWDFYLSGINKWISLGPTCAPDKLQNLLDTTNSHELINFYRSYISDSQTWNQLRSLQTILATQSFLKNNKIKNIQTYMDRELFMPSVTKSRLEHYNAFKDTSWPEITSEHDINTLPGYIKTELDQDYLSSKDPEYIQILQKLALEEIQDFEGKTFLEWSHFQGFEITPVPREHPLEKAHYAAADLWAPRYKQKLQ